MSIYKKFFNETVDENGKLLDIEIHYPDNFNFGYDVIDASQRKIQINAPSSGATPKARSTFFPSATSAARAIALPMCCWLPA